MPPIEPPKDGLGSELHVGDLVVFDPPAIPVWQIAMLQNGGIHTAAGMTPATIQLTANITIATRPGANIPNMIKAVTPGAEDALKRILDASPPPKV